MSANSKCSVASRNLALNAALDTLDGGYLDIYDGTQAVNADTAVSTQTKLARCALGSPAFHPASGGSKTSMQVAGTTALAASTATWCRMVKADETPVWDGSCGLVGSNSDLELSQVDFTFGLPIYIAQIVIAEIA